MKYRSAFWCLVGATAMIYAVLVLILNPELQRLAGGAMPFDLRWNGYSVEAARHFFAAAAMASDGAGRDLAGEFYFHVVKPADTVFPVLFGTVLAWALWVRGPGKWRFLAALALAYIGLDLAENEWIAAMYRAAPDLPATLVETACLLTILKFLSVPPTLFPALWFVLRPDRSG